MKINVENTSLQISFTWLYTKTLWKIQLLDKASSEDNEASDSTRSQDP